MTRITLSTLAAAILLAGAPPAAPGGADVLSAEAVQTANGWRFTVTVRHADTGWEHYADGWGVYAPDGTELGFRVLHHPHVDEQPFTRTLGGVTIPEDIDRVIIRARDSVHGQSGAEMTVPLRRR